jgi:hypothetical protein
MRDLEGGSSAGNLEEERNTLKFGGCFTGYCCGNFFPQNLYIYRFQTLACDAGFGGRKQCWEFGGKEHPEIWRLLYKQCCGDSFFPQNLYIFTSSGL